MVSRGLTLWLTGLPGAAKTAIVQKTADELKRRGCKVEILDDEIIGTNLSSDVTDAQDEGDAGIRRSQFVDELRSRDELVVLAPVNSQGRQALEGLRRKLQNIQPLVEVEIKGSGSSAADSQNSQAAIADNSLQEPLSPDIIVRADVDTPEQCVTHILSKLEDLEMLARPTPQNESYDAEDEEVIRRRLEGLGYL